MSHHSSEVLMAAARSNDLCEGRIAGTIGIKFPSLRVEGTTAPLSLSTVTLLILSCATQDTSHRRHLRKMSDSHQGYDSGAYQDRGNGLTTTPVGVTWLKCPHQLLARRTFLIRSGSAACPRTSRQRSWTSCWKAMVLCSQRRSS